MPNRQYEAGDGGLGARLWSRTRRTETGCLEFTGCLGNKGYGQIGVERKIRSTHRVAWELAYGPIPDGLFVLHHCDNRACIEPTHLFLGTVQDNADDMVAKGRAPRGSVGWKITDEQVRELRRRHIRGCNRWDRGNTVELANEYQISKRHLRAIVKGDWRANA
jgi:Autographiviridae endonuclease